jgi:hypothetical protein
VNRRYLLVLGALAALLLVGFAWPICYLASPRWEVWVVTKDGRPVPDATVALHYRNYSAEGESHSEDLRTDENEHVLFESHYGKASIYQRIFYTLSAADAGVHASFGRHASVSAFGSAGGYIGTSVNGKYIEDWRGSPASMQSKIIAQFVRD